MRKRPYPYQSHHPQWQRRSPPPPRVRTPEPQPADLMNRLHDELHQYLHILPSPFNTNRNIFHESGPPPDAHTRLQKDWTTMLPWSYSPDEIDIPRDNIDLKRYCFPEYTLPTPISMSEPSPNASVIWSDIVDTMLGGRYVLDRSEVLTTIFTAAVDHDDVVAIANDIERKSERLRAILRHLRQYEI